MTAFRLSLLLGAIACLVYQVLATDYYDVLNIPRNAGEDQIRRAYKKLAMKYHPDKVKGTEEEKKAAEQTFQEISAAYAVLSDAEKRRIYDRYGEEGLSQQGRGGGDPHDIFASMFRGFPGFTFTFGDDEPEDETKRGDDVVIQLAVSLRDVYVGKDIEVLRQKAILVTTSGTRDCKCRQEIRTKQLGPGMFQQFQTQVCEKCPNVKFENEDDSMTVHIKRGAYTSQEISFFEEGEPVIDGDPGDLKFIVNVLPDKVFRREGDDLHMEYTVSLLHALTGFSEEVTHLDGHNFTLSSKNVIRPGQVVQIKGEGMPVYQKENSFGRMFVTYNIDFPKKLSSSQQDEIKRILSA